ncbi:efflux RND transporter permease subunit [Lichenicola sp.]|uniref:efflux RND transporter permease subunit n=1 Tax=Lichenicola sp. TaxID=2804529 RepID=UPI003AFFBA95
MRLTDLFIRRPVFALVVSLLILLAGLRAGLTLPMQQFPRTVSATIQIQTSFYGADAATVASFITTPIEAAVSQTEGIDYMTSQSQSGVSTVTLSLRLNQDPNRAMTQVQAFVQGITAQLPAGYQPPVIAVYNAAGQEMQLAVSSNLIAPQQVSDYLTRFVVPQLQAVPGVLSVVNLTQTNIALRVWLDPKRLAGHGLTATDVADALTANDYITGVGTTLGGTIFANLAIASGLHTETEFRNLVVARHDGVLIRLRDIADVGYAPDSLNMSLTDSLGKGAALGISVSPTANLLQVAHRVRATFAAICATMPPGMQGRILYSAADYVDASRHDVLVALGEALVIVALAVLVFLGSPRAVFIPLVTIPLSLIGTLSLMAVMGFSINLLTLLALVLAIGLVVDDAIIIVESVDRHMRQGMTPFASASLAAVGLSGPILAMTVVLVAAYVPIGLQAGLTGALFTEFAFTLAASVTVSAVVALTLSPMMCAYLLRPEQQRPGRLVRFNDAVQHHLERVYRSVLHRALIVWPLLIVFGLAMMVAMVLMFRGSSSELAPQEDTGLLIVGGQAPPNADLDQIARYDPPIIKAMQAIPEGALYWLVDSPGQVGDGIVLKPWNERHRTAMVLQDQLQSALNTVAGLQLAVFQPPSLPGAQGMPIQFVLKGSGSIEALAEVSDRMLIAAHRSGLFTYIDKDLKIDQPQTTIELDRSKLAQIGLRVSDIGSSLNWLLGGNYVNYFSIHGHSYKVMPLVVRDQRLNPAQILDYPIATIGGVPILLSSVATLSHQVMPEQITHFQQLNATTLSGIPGPGVSTDRALHFLQDLARQDLPADFTTDTAGALREYVADQGSFLPSFGFAVIVIFLTLAALFESFRDPLIILASVPMSLAGALFFIWMGVGGASLNIFSEIGLVTLAGLISKHGILIVEVANTQQKLGLSKRAAIELAAVLRLRPILMTTGAMVFGVLPLIVATGAGSAARFAMGLVIATGLGIGTLFTLFVVPAAYLLIAGNHQRSADRRSLPQG